MSDPRPRHARPAWMRGCRACLTTMPCLLRWLPLRARHSAFFLVAVLAWTGARADPHAQPYTWRSVRIGGGGYVTGLVFHPAERGLCYARTDVGGAYRWDDVDRAWVALNDWVDADHVNLNGIDAIALDPADADRLYLVAGTYTTPHAGDAVLLRSNDRGRHFAQTPLPFPMGGNELGRGNGERLAVDPHDGRRLFLATRTAGLWRSDDFAIHWQRVDAFPAVATSDAATASNRWRRQPIGIAFVVFDPSAGRAGQPSPVIYAGVSTRGVALYRSDDGGRHWHAVPGQPVGLRPTHMRRGGDGSWYLTYADQPGPDAMHDGAVWKYQPARQRWTDITPLHDGHPSGYGWGDVAVDPTHPRHLLVSTFAHYAPHDELFRSVDGGAHWQTVFPRSHFDRTDAAWTREHTPHWMSTVAIDPSDPDHAIFVTGYGIWASRDLRQFDRGGDVHWWFQDRGLEETVPLALASPAVGAPLLSAVGDLDGFRHDALDRAPLQFAGPPRYANGESIDVAGRAPQTVVRSGRIRGTSAVVRAAWSRDGGRHWQALIRAPFDGAEAGTIALSADGASIAWHPDRADAVFVTRDGGRHWQRSQTLARDAQVVADRVDAGVFYAWLPAQGALLRSGDDGLHFVPVEGAFAGASARARSADARLSAMPGHAGELWLASASGGIVHGRADGRLLAGGAGFDSVQALGFGRPARADADAALFVAGRWHGQRGLFRSLDDGAHWQRINDDAHQYGQIRAITGDPKVFGRVYVATSGRGIVRGDPVAGARP